MTYINTYSFVFIHVCAFVYFLRYLYTHLYVYANMYVNSCIRTCTHIYICIYVHTHASHDLPSTVRQKLRNRELGIRQRLRRGRPICTLRGCLLSPAILQAKLSSKNPTYVSVYVHTDRVRVHIYIYVYKKSIYVYTYIHPYTYLNVHIYTYIYIYVCKRAPEAWTTGRSTLSG